MEKQLRNFLLDYIKKHSLNNDYTLVDLFYKTYAEQAFSNVDELILGIDEFFDFMLNHIEHINYNENNIIQNNLVRIIENNRSNIKLEFSSKLFDSQKKFATTVSQIFDKPSDISLLDVGAGHSPISSLFFAKNFKKVTAMDSHFYLSLQALKNMNVIGLTEYFTKNTDISDYDLIVGRAPCSAIKPIVVACEKAKKPYLILLCDCALPAPFKADTDSLGWENMLPNIDPNIRFYGQFAYNIDVVPEKIKEILKSYSPKKIKYKDVQLPLKKSNVKVDLDDTFENIKMNYFD